MEQLIEQILKAPLGTKIGVVGGFIALVTMLNYFWLPIGKPISDIEARITKVEAEQRKLNLDLSEKTAIANNLNQFRREKELLEQRLAEALAELPEEKKLDELLKEFQDRAVRAGLEIATIEPGKEASEGFYAKIPIAMGVTGNFHEIATFFDSLSRLRRIVNVNGIAMDSPKDVNGKMVVSAKFIATTFMFLKKPVEAAPTKPGRKAPAPKRPPK
jgi:type IV pilus assembly protein PilO